jgi:carboxypeptidase Q
VNLRSAANVCVLLLVATACGTAPHSAPAALPAPPPTAYDHAYALATQVGPRLAGSPGDARAVAWALERMRAIGLSNVHAEPVAVPVWSRGRESLEVLGTEPRQVRITQLGWTPPTPGDAPIIGDLLVLPSLAAALALEPGAAQGKVVLFNVPMARHADGHGYGDAVSVRYRAGVLGHRLGAAAALLRSVGTDTLNLVHTGSAGHEPLAVPTGAVGGTDADELALRARQGPVSVQLRLQSTQGALATSANVVGEVPGTTHKDHVVLLGAHLDSWDLAQGATDDGAGVGFVLAAAQSLVSSPAARTVRVVLFAAEENSLAGAKAYATAHSAELGSHVAALEMDTGCGRAYEVRLLGAPASATARSALAAGLAPLGIAVSDTPAEGGADIGPLRAAGVPIADLRQDMSTYFDLHHTPEDTADKLDRAAMLQTSRVLGVLVRQMANGDVVLGRVPEAQRIRKY